jgi:hypothetical protein
MRAMPGGTYEAHLVIGGLDRVVIVKRTETTCFGITLRSPGGNEPDLVLPPTPSWCPPSAELGATEIAVD